jgi:Mrp family chromosome partitioning ATPase/capsular polysaccharide biosynthesis protein
LEPEPQQLETSDLRHYLRPVTSRKWAILFVIVAATAAAYLLSDRETRMYRTSTQLFVQPSELEQVLAGGSQQFGDDRTTANQATLLATDGIARRAARKLHYEGDPRALLGSIETSPRSGQDFIDITARDADPQRAADLANAFARAYIDQRGDILRNRVRRARLVAQRELAETPPSSDSRASLLERVRELQAVENLPSSGAEQVSDAEPPGQPYSPRPVRNAVFAGILAAIFAIGAAFGLSRFDRRLRSLEDLETVYRLPLLAALPKVGNPAPIKDGQADVPAQLREACRSLRTNIELASLDKGVKSVLVVSAISGEGKSVVIRNLALVYAEAGLRVAVVEGDLRRPTLARMFAVEPQAGLTDLLTRNFSMEEALAEVQLRQQHAMNGDAPAGRNGHPPDAREQLERHGILRLLASGPEPPNPPALLGTERVQTLLARLKNEYDIVLIDSAPLLVVSDAVSLMSVADAIVVVATVNETYRDAAKRLQAVLARVPDANPVGVVANRVPANEVAGGYRIYSYDTSRR